MRILCVTSVKNEAPFLLEWIAHHQGIGVTDFLIFSNDCEDGTHEMLETLQRAGIVTHVPQTVEADISAQWQALRSAWKHPLRKACEWALVCDVDEFVNVHVGQGTLADLFDAVDPNTDAIVLPWRLFGHNGRAFYEDGLVSELYTASMEESCTYPIAATFFKSLFRTDGPFNQFGVHRPKQKPIEKSRMPVWVNGGGQRMPDFFASHARRLSLFMMPSDRNLVECNHYSLKSAENFIVKRARGLPNRTVKNIDLAYWVERNFNTVENHTIQKVSALTKQRLSALAALPNLSELHESAVSWHKDRFRQLVEVETEYQLFSHILVAGGSQNLPSEVSDWLVSWYQRFIS